MSFVPEPGQYFRMPVFFGPTPGPRQWPAGTEIDFHTTPKSVIAGVRFLSDRDQLQSLLPDCFTVAGEPIVTCNAHYMTELGWLAGRGYDMFDVKFDVVHQGAEQTLGTLVLVRFENLCDPILSGREELGHNKLFCDISPLRAFAGTQGMELSWLNHPFLNLRLEGLQEDMTRPSPIPGHRGMLSYKYIPATGDWGEADVAYATLTPTAPARVTRRFKGEGSVEWLRATWAQLPTLHHLVNGFADLEVKEMRGGFLIEAEGGQSGATTRRLR